MIPAEPRLCRLPTKIPKNPDPALCLDRIDKMYDIYYEQQEIYTARPYMANQKDINTKMRSILIDWLVEVHYKFKLQSPTLWLAINILDRFLEVSQIHRAKLQLVGVCALFIASKFEDIYPPEIKNCVHITDYAYEKAEILAMESQILEQLSYQILVPTGYHFLVKYLACIRASDRTQGLAFFYAERNLQEFDMLSHKPHKIAAAAVYAALKQHECTVPALAGRSCWGEALQRETGLTEEELIPIARTMMQHVSEEPETASKRRLVAAKKKYSTERNFFVSSLPLPTFD